jgi:hypothetical protein
MSLASRLTIHVLFPAYAENEYIINLPDVPFPFFEVLIEDLFLYSQRFRLYIEEQSLPDQHNLF